METRAILIQAGEVNFNSDGQAEFLTPEANDFIQSTLDEYNIIEFVNPEDYSQSTYVVQEQIEFNAQNHAVVLSIDGNDFINQTLSQSGSIRAQTSELSGINISKCTVSNDGCTSNTVC